MLQRGEFECFVCQIKIVKNRKSRSLGVSKVHPHREISILMTCKHKKHIFGDLEPYRCKFAKCPDAPKIFQPRLKLTQHELKDEGVEHQKCLDAGVRFFYQKSVYSARQLSRHLEWHLSLPLAFLLSIGVPEGRENEPKKVMISSRPLDKSFSRVDRRICEEASRKRNAEDWKMEAHVTMWNGKLA
jgi:hypothetical protein